MSYGSNKHCSHQQTSFYSSAQSTPNSMLDRENCSIVGLEHKRTVSAQRRLQNRVAQQRFRERQKANTAPSADQLEAATFNDLDTVRNVDTATSLDSEDLYYQRDPTFPHNSPHNSEQPVASSLGSNPAPVQWHLPSTFSVAPSPQIPHNFDTALDGRMTPNPSYLDVSYESLFGSTDTDWSRQYFHQQLAYLAESNDNALARTQRVLPNEIPTPPAIMTPSSASTSPLYRSSISSYSPNRRSTVSSTSSMGQLVAAQPSSVCNKSSQIRYPLLHVAIRTRKKSMVRLLLRRGASKINEQDQHGRTALHIAAESGDEEIVEVLMKHGANSKLLDNQGLDALHYAVEQGHEDVVEMLLDAMGE
ncbi:hypothetical protein PMIN05_007252 [Paraphaeosphaeria minitans]